MENYDQNFFLIKENNKRQKREVKHKNVKILKKKPCESHKNIKIIHINDEKTNSEFIFENFSIDFEKSNNTSKFFNNSN